MIKTVKSSDINKIFKLEKDIFKQDAFSKDLIKKLIFKNLFFLKLEIDEEMIGFVIVIKDRNDRANIINLIIHPLHQNKGKGSLLIEKTINKIKMLKEIKNIILNVKVSNNSAIKLYEKFHFRIVERIENYYQFSKSDAYLMSLDLINYEESQFLS